MGYIYLIRNGDLYKIGKTNDLQEKIKTLKPDEIIKTLKVEDPRSLEVRLFRRYKSKRIPDSEYFRLSKQQLEDCVNQLGGKGAIPKTIGAEFSIGLSGSVILFCLIFILSIYLDIGLFLSLSLALTTCSLPMWCLFVLGNFGGYDIADLPLFASWSNRFKGLLLAASITSIAYILYAFIN